MLVQDIMTTNVSCCTRETALSDVARIMLDQDCGEVPIVNDMNALDLIGVITDRDIVVRAISKEMSPATTRVEEIMTDRVIIVHPDTDIEESIRIMSQNQIRRVPVVDEDNRVVGMLSLADISRETDPQTAGQVVQDISQPDGADVSTMGMAQRGQTQQPNHPVI